MKVILCFGVAQEVRCYNPPPAASRSSNPSDLPVRAKPGVTTKSPHQVTQPLLAWSEGYGAALDELMPLVERELHRLADPYMRRENAGQTVQTTALVNEAYLRLIEQKRVHWNNRAHCFALSAQLMRRILVDLARKRRYSKRGGGVQQVSFDEAFIVSRERGRDVIALDEALTRLAEIETRKSQLVELRFFGGLSVEETAEALHISGVTVMREWSLAKAWLYNAVNNEA
jgi:RNA polymerase sigma factor (TIGR02999 family)